MSTASTTSEIILASARSFIVAGGYNAFSYADIAAVVGIRKASIHHHFPTKADLVRTLVRQYREQADHGLRAMSARVADPAEVLRLYAAYWGRCIEDGSLPFCVCALLACELPTLPPEVALEVSAHFQTLSAWLTEVIERGVKSGRLRTDSTAAVEANKVMATVHGAMLSVRATADPTLFATIVEPTLRSLMAPGG